MDYIISDLHVDHEKILKYENRPFETVKEMNEHLIDNWNKVVNPNDRVFLLGDVMFTHQPNKVIELLNKLNGNIVIVLGNHDAPLKRLYDTHQYVDRKKKIYIAGQIYEPKVDVGFNKFEKVVMSHYPLYSWNAAFHGRKHFYGHIHSRKIVGLTNAFNVSADIQNFKPKLIRDVINA